VIGFDSAAIYAAEHIESDVLLLADRDVW